MLNEAMRQALAADVVRPVYAVEIRWPGEIMRAHTGVGDLTVEGNLFEGVGDLGSVSTIKQQAGDSPDRLTLSLSGFDDSVRGEALRAQYQGRPVSVWLVLLDEQYQPLASQTVWRGSIVDVKVSVGEVNEIELTVSNRMEDWDKKRPDRFTDESQQSRHKGDRIFRYVPIMAEWPIYWGSDKQATPLRDAL